jgi:glycosyltransferase involved in cell wall biosynthesis
MIRYVKNKKSVPTSVSKPISTIPNNNSVINEERITHINVTPDNVIKYIGQTGTSGYASAAKGYIADYILRNIPISWQRLQFDNSKNDQNYYVDALCESVVNKVYKKYKRVILHSTPDLWDSFIKENKNINEIIGFCTWETSKLPEKWVEHINLVSEVWVPSTFNKECFINSGVKSKIEVVPHIWHKQLLYNKKEVDVYDYSKNLIPRNKFTFYTVGELNNRKGIEELVTVFDRFNREYPDTQLIIKTHFKEYNSMSRHYCIGKISKLTNKFGKNVFLILDNLSNDEILGLHSFGDCYVSLNKGEGFGLTVFDAYNLGKNVITTGYGGQIDYLGKDYKGLVDFKINKVSGMEMFSTNYTKDQEWAYPDLDHAYELMKLFYDT